MAAAAVAQSGIAPEAALAAFAQVGDVDGRYVEAAGPGGRTVRLLLGKNPASWTELIDMVAGPADAGGLAGPRGLVIAINARGADGRDPSWLWDVPFERLAGRPVWAAGERRYDLAGRRVAAGLDVRGVVADPLAAAGRADGAGPVDIVANYTAFQNVRARLGLGVKVA
ncbi:MAG: DUF1727 domain-containing protein, partial [Bifidobacteriaceae bacterium]|jgi:UDP-N-acetylmuramyl tripeptide synthase|nr:DUF1727 domain-containing protein [Bifidobacteriaceae bacterium]